MFTIKKLFTICEYFKNGKKIIRHYYYITGFLVAQKIDSFSDNWVENRRTESLRKDDGGCNESVPRCNFT